MDRMEVFLLLWNVSFFCSKVTLFKQDLPSSTLPHQQNLLLRHIAKFDNLFVLVWLQAGSTEKTTKTNVVGIRHFLDLLVIFIMYCLQTILPNDQWVRYGGLGQIEILQDVDVPAAADSYITVHNKDGSSDRILLSLTGEIFNFDYIHRLTFLHSGDLRNAPYWSIDFDSTLPVAGKGIGDLLDTGHICESICIRHVGVLDDSGIDVGYGIFAEKDILKGTFIGEYVGVVSEASATSSSCYALNYPCKMGGYTIDSNDTGNIIRMINHSNNHNSCFQNVVHDNLVHVICVSAAHLSVVLHCGNVVTRCLFQVTKRDIKQGEQVSVDYGGSYWASKTYKPLDFE